MELLTTENTKLKKGDKLYRVAGLSLAPENTAGIGRSVCPYSTPGCRKSCINTSGLAAVYPAIERARINKTLFFWENREAFLNQLYWDIFKFLKKCRQEKAIPVIRLNVFSDIPWWSISTIMYDFPTVQFYDYTKNKRTLRYYLKRKLPLNYHLTFSLSERNHAICRTLLHKKRPINIAVPFNIPRNSPLPATFWGKPVIDGDISDLRFLDPDGGFIIGLRVKGQGKKDKTGFIQPGIAS